MKIAGETVVQMTVQHLQRGRFGRRQAGMRRRNSETDGINGSATLRRRWAQQNGALGLGTIEDETGSEGTTGQGGLLDHSHVLVPGHPAVQVHFEQDDPLHLRLLLALVGQVTTYHHAALKGIGKGLGTITPTRGVVRGPGLTRPVSHEMTLAGALEDVGVRVHMAGGEVSHHLSTVSKLKLDPLRQAGTTLPVLQT